MEQTLKQKLNDTKICIDYGPIDYKTFQVENIEYIELDGWNTSTVGIKNFDNLPENARKYIKTIEDISSTPIVMISTGPSRDQIIKIRDIFK